MRRLSEVSFFGSGFGSGSVSRRAANLAAGGAILLAVGAAGVAQAQAPAAPAPMNETGCCCIAIKGGKIGCGQKTQAECLAEQPKTPTYDQLPGWADAVKTSQAQESAKIRTGWHAGACEG